ncbi:MAG TPA: hypothetical protein VLB06_07865, partial [Sulfuricaulis sp.]|nr:hypothetical protein [Sulfuricaulis sp.]
MKQTRSEALTVTRAVVAIVVIAFFVELVIMQTLLFFGHAHHESLLFTIIDAAILSLVIAPPIYWLVLSPIRQEYEKRLKA